VGVTAFPIDAVGKGEAAVAVTFALTAGVPSESGRRFPLSPVFDRNKYSAPKDAISANTVSAVYTNIFPRAHESAFWVSEGLACALAAANVFAVGKISGGD